jgi:predicted P-loop ATPase
VPRIGTWLRDYAGAEDTDFNGACGRLFLVAGVRRICHPGAKFDTMLVFESPIQGLDKSSALRALAVRDPWFTDNMQLGVSAKEMIEGTQGVWIVEFGELSGMERREREQILTFLSRQEDRARPAYGRRPARVPRQFIGAATTNKTDYLTHEERRILPVRIKRFLLEALRRDRDQLWAEAAHYEAQGEPITLPENLWAEAANVRKDRRRENPSCRSWRNILRSGAIPKPSRPPQSGRPSAKILVDHGNAEMEPVLLGMESARGFYFRQGFE